MNSQRNFAPHINVRTKDNGSFKIANYIDSLIQAIICQVRSNSIYIWNWPYQIYNWDPQKKNPATRMAGFFPLRRLDVIHEC